MGWPTALTDIRTALSDDQTDRLSYRKRVSGQSVDGINRTFKTFEFRRLTNFTTAISPLGVYVSGVAVACATDDTSTGEFTLTAAPPMDSVIEATYFFQWFIDSEIIMFLTQASNWLGFGGDYLNAIPAGLQPAALFYATGMGYYKLSNKWAERLSSTFMLEDSPKKESMPVAEGYIKVGERFIKQAEDARMSYYRRQDQSAAPLWGTILGPVTDATPRR